MAAKSPIDNLVTVYYTSIETGQKEKKHFFL
jgi:hypothetical protein